LGTFLGSEVKRSFQMDVIKDLLAAISGVLNGLPQGLLAMTFGFASVPTAIAFVIGAFGNTFTSNVAVISFQAETITVAGTMGKNIRERLSMIFLDRKSTRLNSSHVSISYAVFCLKKNNSTNH